MIVITSMNELPRSCMTCPFQKNKKTPFCRAKRNWYRPFENIPPSFGFYIRDDAFLKGQTPWNARAKWCPLIEVADRKTENSSEKPNNCEELNAYRKCVESRSFWDNKHCDGCYFDERCPFDEPMKTTDYCDICKRDMCEICVADATNPYCVPSHYEINYEPKDEPQTERSE